MKTTPFYFCCALLVCSLLFACKRYEENIASDLAGDWRLTRLLVDGKDSTDYVRNVCFKDTMVLEYTHNGFREEIMSFRKFKDSLSTGGLWYLKDNNANMSIDLGVTYVYTWEYRYINGVLYRGNRKAIGSFTLIYPFDTTAQDWQFKDYKRDKSRKLVNFRLLKTKNGKNYEITFNRIGQ